MSTAQISTVIQPIAPRGEFRNEPFIDFRDSENGHAMQAALTRVGDMLGHEYELVIGGGRSWTPVEKDWWKPPGAEARVGGACKEGRASPDPSMHGSVAGVAGWAKE